MSTAVQVVEALMTNIRTLASDDSYKSLASLFDEIPQLKAQLKSKDVEISNFKAQIQALNSTHEAHLRQDLATYFAERQAFEEQKTKLDNKISNFVEENKKRDANAAEHHLTLEKLKEQLQLNKKKLQEEEGKVKVANAEITKLNQSIKSRDNGLDKMKESLRTERSQAAEAKTHLRNLSDAKASLEKECRSNNERLGEVDRFTVKLIDEDEAMWYA